MIEKRISHQLLESGELSLTKLESNALTLPEHSATIGMELEGEPFHAQWSGRSRHLSGDLLTERLQDYGQERGLLRIRLVGDVYRLELLPPGAPGLITAAAPPITPVTKPRSTKAKRRATVDRQFHGDTEYDWNTGSTPTIGFLKAARELLGDQLKAAGFDPLALVELRLQGEELATLDDFEELLAVDVANVDRMPHQEAVAKHALSRLRGRAVLADEVGLGKTVEAGLAVKELTLRGLAKRILILCPAPLREQWREEMSNKFDLNFEVAMSGLDVQRQDKLILSLQLGVKNASKLAKEAWDIVIIDEAHRASGAGARKTRELITSLTTACRYAFFLTATPVQNDLLELYRLVELLRPGTFESVNAFKRQFMQSYDPRTPNDPAALRRLISSVMIRTTRAQAGVDRVTRRAVDVPVDLGPRERELYALSTNLLRNVMRDSGDTMRRRSLALRLTASPFSMGTTALRMADRHPDPRVKSVLNEVGHLAMDIKDSARENKALEITHDWLKKHGRVLIFTQHTDTVSGLLRRMHVEGIAARAFHGSMSAGERAATIAAFRSGDAPVMISTDAGAEGQNLQFCNCVLNFDLPWNPMRIEQRIGRVDRLTQPKDEVFVANLYARGTIDEGVYKLLAEKLRMFELLFGQVTTILGELDDSKAATFESRVLEALFSPTDSRMDGLLKQLGTELVHAREKASELIAADSGLSNWMAEAFEYRKNLSKAGSSELAPEVSDRARMRQRRVQAWVRSVLGALDVQLIHDTGEGDGAFITAQFDEEYEEELGGRTLMHLAFDRLGLEHHPDAELCAVGSPAFDELLGLLRMRGDMHATVPVIPEDIGLSRIAHAPNTKLLSRRLVPSGSWSGQATFRATIGEAETTEHLLTSDINGHNEQRMPRRPLTDGETLPSAFGTAPKVIKNFERAAASQLESLRRSRAKQVEKEQTNELRRISIGYNAQIAEATGEDRQRLRRALKSEERRLSRRPDIRARAKILALTLDEDDWLVEETWEGPGGVVGKLTYEYGFDGAPDVESDVSGKDIEILALCSSGHWVDKTETVHCDSCDGELCEACGDDAIFADCAVCGLSSCGVCRGKHEALCRRCGTPKRTPELDSEFAVAWTLNRHNVLRVGDRIAELVGPGSVSPTVLVPDSDVNDQSRARVRAYARQQNLPMDCGLELRDLTRQPEAKNSERMRLTTSASVGVELTIASTSTPLVDAGGAADLPEGQPTDAVSERDLMLEDLLGRLRRDAPPSPPPAIIVTRRSSFVDTYLEADRLVQETSTVTDDGAVAVSDVQSAPFRWRTPSVTDALIADASIGDSRVLLQRRNDAVLVQLEKRGSDEPAQWVACPDGAQVAHQLGCFDYLSSLGTPGARLGKRTGELLKLYPPFPTPTECRLVQRDIQQVARVMDYEPEVDVTTADDASLAALGVRPDTKAAKQLGTLPTHLNQALIDQTRRPFSSVIYSGLEVTEIWHGRGQAIHSYITFEGQALSPIADDLDVRASDFGVCRDGHFYSAGSAALCASCNSWSCRACDDIEQQASIPCPSCAYGVCRRCLASDHSVSVSSCLVCSGHACSTCGRDPLVAACKMCDRTMCTLCRVEDICNACNSFRPATDEERQSLPADLIASGASLLVGTDSDATVVLLNRGNDSERAVIRGDSVDHWVTFGRREISAAYTLRLRASAALGRPVALIRQPLEPEKARAEPRLIVRAERAYYPYWSVPQLGADGYGTNPVESPDGDLAPLLAAEFPVLQRMPEPVPIVPPRVARRIRKMTPPDALNLAMTWHRRGRDVSITAKGIKDVTLNGDVEQISDFPWTETSPSLQWVSDAWSPEPAVRAYAAGRDVEAAIVGMASMLALGIRTAERTEWFVVNASENAAAATILSRLTSRGDADDVTIFTDPSLLKLSTIVNKLGSSLDIRPIGSLQPGPRTQDSDVQNALAAWTPTATVIAPDLLTLPHDLRLALEALMRPSPPRMRLDIGALVTETVTIEGGREWRYEMHLAPGDTDARRIDEVTRQVIDSGEIDREGHFSSACRACDYCAEKTCEVCVDGLVVCDCCGVELCKRCVATPHASLWLCPACSSTRRPTRNEARAHGRLMMTKGMLIGVDKLHTVVVEQSKAQWVRHAQGGQKQAIANPSVISFLNARSTDSD